MKNDIIPVVMVGAGPSALAAAIYTTREAIDTVLYEKGVVGGLAAITDQVDNYPGFPDGIAGMQLAEQLQKQAERFGAKIEYGDVSALRTVLLKCIVIFCRQLICLRLHFCLVCF